MTFAYYVMSAKAYYSWKVNSTQQRLFVSIQHTAFNTPEGIHIHKPLKYQPLGMATPY